MNLVDKVSNLDGYCKRKKAHQRCAPNIFSPQTLKLNPYISVFTRRLGKLESLI